MCSACEEDGVTVLSGGFGGRDRDWKRGREYHQHLHQAGADDTAGQEENQRTSSHREAEQSSSVVEG